MPNFTLKCDVVVVYPFYMYAFLKQPGAEQKSIGNRYVVLLLRFVIFEVCIVRFALWTFPLAFYLVLLLLDITSCDSFPYLFAVLCFTFIIIYIPIQCRTFYFFSLI